MACPLVSLPICLNLPAIISQTTVKRIVAALTLKPIFLFSEKLPVYAKRLILFAALLLLFSAEILRVYFLMPFLNLKSQIVASKIFTHFHLQCFF